MLSRSFSPCYLIPDLEPVVHGSLSLPGWLMGVFHNVEHSPMLIDCSPEGVPLAIDRKKDLVQVPLVATAKATRQFIGIHLPEFEVPLSYGFVGQYDSALGHELFDVARAEGKTEIQPGAVTDDVGWKAVAFVIGGNHVCFQATSMPYYSTICIVASQVDNTEQNVAGKHITRWIYWDREES